MQSILIAPKKEQLTCDSQIAIQCVRRCKTFFTARLQRERVGGRARASKRVIILSSILTCVFLVPGAPSSFESGESLSLNGFTFFAQTNVLGPLCLLAALTGILLRLPMQRTLARQIRIDVRLQERERIARELHDTLIQSTQGLILSFQGIAGELPESAPMRRKMEATLDRADNLLREARDRVSNLRFIYRDFDLTQALSRVTSELSVDRTVGNTVTVSGTPRSLTQAVANETYLIAREALTNAYVHADANHIELQIIFTQTQFILRIRDDGRGIGTDIMKLGSRPRHFGLKGMRERAACIGARLHTRSDDGRGTEIELSIPAEIAYAGFAVPWIWAIFSRVTSRASSQMYLTQVDEIRDGY